MKPEILEYVPITTVKITPLFGMKTRYQRRRFLQILTRGSNCNHAHIMDVSQARTQACLSGVANFHWRNHVVQNLRAYIILYVITIKCINCMQEKAEFSCKLQRPMLISTKILGDLSLATKIKQQKQQQKIARKFSGGGKKTASCCPDGIHATL